MTQAAPPVVGTPTAWYFASSKKVQGGFPTAAARTYWPESAVVEWTDYTGNWQPKQEIAESLATDPGWVEVTEELVQRWIDNAPKPGQAPPQ